VKEHPKQPPALEAIPVRRFATRAKADEAMLALQSLDIPAWLRHDATAPVHPWLIEAPDARSALAADQQLAELAEEHGRGATRPAPIAPMLGVKAGSYWIVGLILANVLVFAAMEQLGGSESRATLLRFGAITTPLLHALELWRLVTATFIHIGSRHLLGNMVLLAVLGTVCLRLWGPGRLLAIYLGGGVIGNIAGMLFGSAIALKAGASGAILALLGGLAGQRLRELTQPFTHRYKTWHVLASLVAFYGMVVGIRPESDHVAHVGGIVGGALIALALPAPGSWSSKREGWLQGVLAVSSIAVATIAGLFAFIRGATP
jgi:rhomboid protease GluP